MAGFCVYTIRSLVGLLPSQDKLGAKLLNAQDDLSESQYVGFPKKCFMAGWGDSLLGRAMCLLPSHVHV